MLAFFFFFFLAGYSVLECVICNKHDILPGVSTSKRFNHSISLEDIAKRCNPYFIWEEKMDTMIG